MKIPTLFKRKQKNSTKPIDPAVLAGMRKVYELILKDHYEEEDPNPFTAEDWDKAMKLLSEKQSVIEGDGKAEFLEPMSDAEYVKYMHEETHGWKGVYNRLLNRGEQ